MKFNPNVGAICLAAVICSVAFFGAVASVNKTILQAATIAGDKMSPRLQPTEHNITVDGGVLVGNRKGALFDVGMTMGKERQ
jgi:hypothetical protein